MKYLKIINLFGNQKSGDVDYKGLIIEQFTPYSQVYDFENGVCLVQTSEDNYTPHADVIELTESEYNEQRDIINSMSPQVQEENKIEELEKKIALQDKAILELTQLLAGGVA